VDVVTPEPRQLRAAADRILELHEAGEIDAAHAACLQLERDAGGDLSDRVVRESVFTARFERGVLATEAGDLPAAAAGYLAAAGLPFDESDPDEAHELAMALLNAGIAWSALGDDTAALATYDELVTRLGAATDPVTRDQVVRARVNRAVALLSLDRFDDAVTAAAALAAELDADDPAEAEQRGMALRVRAAALRAGDRPEDAIVTLAEAEPLAEVAEVGAREQAAAAQGERAELLAELGRAGEAIELLERATVRFGDDPDLRGVVTQLLDAEAELLDATGEPGRASEVRERLSRSR
jgi:tetratricopeptide (TPR) repeat protein